MENGPESKQSSTGPFLFGLVAESQNCDDRFS
jgi:hypothetical protein